MKTARYNKIKTTMPDSLRMKLDHIKRYLDEGKAAALIGAGFSKNARMPEAAEMKDEGIRGRFLDPLFTCTLDVAQSCAKLQLAFAA